MKQLGSWKIVAISLCMSLALAGHSANVRGAQSESTGKATQFRTSKYLYEKCKEALGSHDFESSYCAAYIEGYFVGGSVKGLYILGQANNQLEIIENSDKNPCSSLDKDLRRENPVRWTAEFFVNWIDNNSAVIEGERAFLEREAATTLHTITTDERFCTTKSIDVKKRQIDKE